MIPLSLSQIAQAVGGELNDEVFGDAVVTGEVVIDSRKVAPGDLFVAIAGERVDGSDFAQAALDAGAVGVLGAHAVATPTVVVDDPIAALGRLATTVHAQLPSMVTVGLTGSSGKTSTKDLLACVLAEAGPTVAPTGSFNNELGLPLTVLRCTDHTKYLVLEMGARGKGHIRYLCDLTPIGVGLVLNVGSAHVGEFGSQQAIAEAKSEIVQGLGPDSLAVLNADDPLVRAMASLTPAHVLTFGESPKADVRIESLRLDAEARPRFTLRHGQDSAEVALQLSGEHMASNAAAAAAVALGLGLELNDVAAALGQAQARSRWRMEVHRTPAGVTIINDAYNANPESMRAGLKALMAMQCEGRRWAVLGEMLELGESSTDEHDALGRLAVRLDVSRLVAVGPGARPIHLGAAHEGSWGDESTWVPDTQAAIELLEAQVAPGDVVLVKASRSIGLERVAQALLGEEAQP